MGDAPWAPWPRDQQGDPLARMGLSAPSGAADLKVRATMQSEFAPSRGHAEVEFLHGILFGGHWVEQVGLHVDAAVTVSVLFSPHSLHRKIFILYLSVKTLSPSSRFDAILSCSFQSLMESVCLPVLSTTAQ